MRQIRRGVFETNSSSVHSLTIVDKEEFEKFKKGEYLINYDGGFVTREYAINELKKYYIDLDLEDEDKINLELKRNEYYNYDNYGCSYNYEYFEKSYKTKNGDEIVAFGYSGYDN